MEEQADDLLIHLEVEGRQIAECRKLLSDLILSSDKINCSKMLSLCSKLNAHISAFDQINEQLTELEKLCHL